jgi:hypothetical protein
MFSLLSTLSSRASAVNLTLSSRGPKPEGSAFCSAGFQPTFVYRPCLQRRPKPFGCHSVNASSRQRYHPEASSSRQSLAANVYLLPRKGYQQDALFAARKVELRGVREVIRSFRASTKSAERSAFCSVGFQPALVYRPCLQRRPKPFGCHPVTASSRLCCHPEGRTGSPARVAFTRAGVGSPRDLLFSFSWLLSRPLVAQVCSRSRASVNSLDFWLLAPRREEFDSRGKTDVTLAKDRAPRERQKSLLAASKKFTTPRCAAKQNHLFRTNRAPGTSFVAQVSPTVFCRTGDLRLFLAPPSLSECPEIPRSVKSRNFSTCAHGARNPCRISTSIFKDLKLPRINTCRNKTIERQNFCVPLWSSQARPARDLSTNPCANHARNSSRISTSVFKDLNLLRINTYRNKFWPLPRTSFDAHRLPMQGVGVYCRSIEDTQCRVRKRNTVRSSSSRKKEITPWPRPTCRLPH